MKTSTIATKKIKVSVIEAGTLTIPCDFAQIGNISHSGNLADYEFSSAESLYDQASKMQFVERVLNEGKFEEWGEVIEPRNIKTIKGYEYTLKMAQNDFNKFAK